MNITDYLDATKTSSAVWLSILTDRNFWIASDLETKFVYGRFNGVWWAA